LDQYRINKQNEAIDDYIQIWSVLVNSFKKYTDFSLEEDSESKTKIVVNWFLKALQKTFLFLIGANSDTGRDMIIGKFIEWFLTLMFSPAAATLFAYLNTIVATVLTPLVEWFIDEFKAKFEDFGMALFRNIKISLGKKNVHQLIDFDYMKYLNSTEEGDDSKPEITIEAKKVDDAYKAAIEYKTNPMSISDRVYLYNDNDRILPLENIGDSQIFIDMEKFKKTRRSTDPQILKYENFLAKDAELMELRDAVLQQDGQVERLKSRLVVV
jgi:hypothetical protein